ncbi:hypothetical protein JCM3766R1_006377 [Sporobolomyces carnicolor]
MPAEIKDSFKIGSKCLILADCDMRGDISIGDGCVIQPRCTLLALSGPIVLGTDNVLEENVVIVNRLRRPLVIGDYNLFQVGSRIESPRIGSHNNFGIRSRTSPHVSIGSNCTIGSACLVLPSPFPTRRRPREQPRADDDKGEETDPGARDGEQAGGEEPLDNDEAVEVLASNTTVFGSDNRRRTIDNPDDARQGSVQARALFVKHLEYLRETLPRFHKLKMF